MKQYPLILEKMWQFKDGEVRNQGYFSKGYHDRESFIAALAQLGYAPIKPKIKQAFLKKIPKVRGLIMEVHEVDGPSFSAFPATVFYL